MCYFWKKIKDNQTEVPEDYKGNIIIRDSTLRFAINILNLITNNITHVIFTKSTISTYANIYPYDNNITLVRNPEYLKNYLSKRPINIIARDSSGIGARVQLVI